MISDDEPAQHPRLPDDLARLLSETMNRIYQEDADADPDYAPKITASDVDDTYRLWYRFMKGFTESGTLPPPVAYSFTAEMREVWEKTMDNLGDVGDFLQGAADIAGKFGILSIFIMLAALVAAAVMAAAAIANGIAGAIATLGSATIRYAACLIYEQLYDAFQNFRLAISLNGLAFPMLEHLNEPRFAQFVTPAGRDSTGVNAADAAARLPLLHFTPSFLANPLAVLFHQERHLVNPPTDGEKVAAHAAPVSYRTRFATHYAFERIHIDRDLLDDLVSLAGEDDREEARLTAVLEGRTLGNALDLTAAMYERWFESRPLSAFNLDADRGYGYVCWTQRGDPPHQPTKLASNTSDADPAQVELDTLP